MDAEKARRLDAFRLDQYRSLMAVDRGVGDLVDALRDTGRLANTLIVFAPDNVHETGVSPGGQSVSCSVQKLRLRADQSIPKLGWMAVRPATSKSH